jgi:hypothetical protein
MELWIEKYGSRRFGRQMVFSLASEGICRIFEWLEALARKKGALAKFGDSSGIFVVFGVVMT